jgi:hypothetical protein
MGNFEKMVMNLGDFLVSPVGIVIEVMLLLGILGIAVLTKRVRGKKKRRTYTLLRERLGQELLIEISEALNRAATENRPAKLRVRKISTDFIKMVAVDSYAFHESKGSRLLEVEIKPLRVLPIIIKKGATREETSQLAPGQLAALCEAVKNYDPVEAL